MLRKITAISILSFASMIMLAFVVFPHHHHHEYICFADNHCQDEQDADHHSHDDSPFSSDNGCVKHLFQTQVSRIQTFEHSCGEGHCHHFTLALFPIANIFEFLSYEADCKTITLPVYWERLYADCYSSDLFGRAPPYNG